MFVDTTLSGLEGEWPRSKGKELNAFVDACIRAQTMLLDMGFSSSFDKQKALLKSNVALLTCEEQFKHEFGSKDKTEPSNAVVASTFSIRRQIIDNFFFLLNLRCNYRLAKMLGYFKEEVDADRLQTTEIVLAAQFQAEQAEDRKQLEEVLERLEREEEALARNERLVQQEAGRLQNENDDDGDDGDGPTPDADLLFQRKVVEDLRAKRRELEEKLLKGAKAKKHDDLLRGKEKEWNAKFQSLFQDNDELKFDSMLGREDGFFSDVIKQNILSEDDNLTAASLHLLIASFSQRKQLVDALQDVRIRREPTNIPVYGHIEALMADIVELEQLVNVRLLFLIRE